MGSGTRDDAGGRDRRIDRGVAFRHRRRRQLHAAVRSDGGGYGARGRSDHRGESRGGLSAAFKVRNTIDVLPLAGDDDRIDGPSGRWMRHHRSRVLRSPQAKTKPIVANIATTAMATMMLSTGI